MNRLSENPNDKKQVISYYQKKRGLREIYSTTLSDDVTEKIIKLQELKKYY